MDPVDAYRELARTGTRAEFSARFAGMYLLKRPRKNAQAPVKPLEIRFATLQEKTEIDPFAAEWRIAPVRKKPENPYPERLTVGRATNCDVVLRVPFISKVHGHIVVKPDGGLELQALQGSQKILHNFRELRPGAGRPLSLGDRLSFGTLEFELVSAEMLYDILRTAAAT